MSDLDTWRAEYARKLSADYGWWAITALAWLERGSNLLGSESGARVRLPERAPGRLADLAFDGEAVIVTPLAAGLQVDGAPVAEPLRVAANQTLMVADAAAAVRVNLIRRGELCGARVYDPLAAAARDPEAEIGWFEADPCWRVSAEFLPPEPGELVDVVNVLGHVTPTPVAGRARFYLDGTPHTLLATADGRPGSLFFNFKDETNRSVTYGGGRFLNVPGPVDGRLVLDFNYAHHPPCAHTPHATCPTPSAENRLIVAVLAGERYPRT